MTGLLLMLSIPRAWDLVSMCCCGLFLIILVTSDYVQLNIFTFNVSTISPSWYVCTMENTDWTGLGDGKFTNVEDGCRKEREDDTDSYGYDGIDPWRSLLHAYSTRM